MRTRYSSTLEPEMSPSASEDLIDPQLRESATTSSALSLAGTEHDVSAVDSQSVGIATMDSNFDDNIDDDAIAAMVQADPQGGQDLTQQSQTSFTGQRMAGVGRLATMHNDSGVLGEGYQHFMQRRRRLDIPNDDYAVLSSNNTAYVRYVYNFITTTPVSMDEEQTSQAKLLAKKLKAFGDDADQCMADIASMLVAAVHELHARGDRLFEVQFKALKPFKSEDLTMTATQRVDTICDILHGYKKHVIDLMEGFDHVVKFVAAPRGIYKRKQSYKPNNNSRREKLTRLREIEKSLGQGAGGAKSGEDEQVEEDEQDEQEEQDEQDDQDDVYDEDEDMDLDT